jgi:hypothetical protein
MKKVNLLIAISSLFFCESSGQPYWYFMYADSGSWHPTNIARMDLSSGKIEDFIPQTGQMIDLAASSDQEYLLINYRFEGKLEFVKINNPSRPVLLMKNIGAIKEFLVDTLNSKMIISCLSDTSDYMPPIPIYNLPSLSINSYVTEFGPYYRNICIGGDGNLFAVVTDTLQDALLMKSVNWKSHLIKSKAITNPGESNSDLLVESIAGDGSFLFIHFNRAIKKGIAYSVYNLVSNMNYPEVIFPWQCETALSPDGERIIFERTYIDRSNDNAQVHTGEFFVFDSKAGTLKQRAVLPPQGMSRTVGSYPDKFYYFFPSAQMSFTIDLTKISPVSTLIDTLRAMHSQEAIAGRFIECEFRERMALLLDDASTTLTAGDTAGCAMRLRVYKSSLDSAYTDTLNGPSPLNHSAWRQLSFNASYIIDRLPSPYTQFPITVTPGLHGHIILDPDRKGYDSSSTVRLTAIPDTGYEFAGWSGDITGKSNPLQLIISRPLGISAQFTPAVYTIIASAGEHGKIIPSGGIQLSYGSSQDFDFRPDEFYHVASVTVDAGRVDTAREYHFKKISSSHSIHVEFGPDVFTLELVIKGKGSVKRNPEMKEYPRGTIVHLEAVVPAALTKKERDILSIPDKESSDWIFDHWEGDVTGKQNPISIQMNAKKSIRAVYRTIRRVQDETP